VWIQKVPGGGVAALAYAPDGRTLYTLDNSGTLTAWDVASRTGNKLIRDPRLKYYYGHVYLFANGTRLITRQRAITTWDLATKQELATSTLPDTFDWWNSCVRSDGRIFVASGSEPTITGWNLTTDTPEPERTVAATDDRISDFDLAPDERSVVIAFCSGPIAIFEWSDGPELRNPVAVAQALTPGEARFSPDGRTLVFSTDSHPRKVSLWDVPTRRTRVENVYCWLDSRLAFNPAFPLFAGCRCRDNGLAVWDLDTGEQVRALDFALGLTVSCACFSPDGLTCAVGGSNKQFAVFDVDL
jgi:WD40 repeat protein